MDRYRDLLIKYYQDTWDAMPKKLRTKRQVSVMLDCGHLDLPFEETYKDELLALPIVTLNKMNLWSLKGEETLIVDFGYCLKICFLHEYFYTKDEFTDRLIMHIVWRFTFRMCRKLEKECRLFRYLSKRTDKNLRLLRESFEWANM